MKKAYFAGGCFWCTEALFEGIRGVLEVVSGYAGGDMEEPLYEDVSSGNTGHAEAIEVIYDPAKIKYSDLLYIFFRTHDPTTLNRQGADSGAQYRSAVFYTTDEEKKEAEKAKNEAQKDYSTPIVTELARLGKFYKAEGYHQDYYKNNKEAAYCKVVIDPKIASLKKNFGKYVK